MSNIVNNQKHHCISNAISICMVYSVAIFWCAAFFGGAAAVVRHGGYIAPRNFFQRLVVMAVILEHVNGVFHLFLRLFGSGAEFVCSSYFRLKCDDD